MTRPPLHDGEHQMVMVCLKCQIAVERDVDRQVELRIRSGAYLAYHAGPRNLVADARAAVFEEAEREAANR